MDAVKFFNKYMHSIASLLISCYGNNSKQNLLESWPDRFLHFNYYWCTTSVLWYGTTMWWHRGGLLILIPAGVMMIPQDGLKLLLTPNESPHPAIPVYWCPSDTLPSCISIIFLMNISTLHSSLHKTLQNSSSLTLHNGYVHVYIQYF